MKIFKRFKFLPLLALIAAVFTMLAVGCDDSSSSGSANGEGTTVNPIEGESFILKSVPAGAFMIDQGGSPDEFNGNLIKMTISKGYYIAETEVTQELWEAVMDKNPSAYQKENGAPLAPGEKDKLRPVDSLTWYDAVEFCNKLSVLNSRDEVYAITNIMRDVNSDEPRLSKSIISATVTADLSKNGYRLPTEMEWMWAAMGATEGEGTRTGGVFTDGYLKAYAGHDRTEDPDGSKIGDYGWYEDNSDDMPHQVALKKPNELGLYDMSGNVEEWCWDIGDTAYPTGSKEDYYKYDPSSSRRMGRGSEYNNEASNLAVADRGGDDANAQNGDMGFRFVRNAE